MHKHLKAERCVGKHEIILTVDNIAARDKITTPSSALACSRLENGSIVIILQSLVCGFNSARRQGGTFIWEGKQF